jgi:hypothetical protein
MPLNGLYIAVPASVTAFGTGSSSSISSSGSITFTSASTLNINNVFSSAYDNYMVVMRYSGGTTGSNRTYFRLLANGNASSTASYTWNTTTGDGAVVGGERIENDTYGYFTLHGMGLPSGTIGYIYNPFTTKRTIARTSNVCRTTGGTVLWESATRHELPVSYDGISLLTEAGSISGQITFYGIRN